jgi:hypothetical protein
MKLDFIDRFSKISSNTKFGENLFSGSRVVSCGRTDIAMLMVAFCSFANVSKTFCR